MAIIDFKIDDNKLDSTRKAQKEFDELNEEEKKCLIDFNINDDFNDEAKLFEKNVETNIDPPLSSIELSQPIDLTLEDDFVTHKPPQFSSSLSHQIVQILSKL